MKNHASIRLETDGWSQLAAAVVAQAARDARAGDYQALWFMRTQAADWLAALGIDGDCQDKIEKCFGDVRHRNAIRRCGRRQVLPDAPAARPGAKRAELLP